MKGIFTLAIATLITSLGFGQCLQGDYPFNGDANDQTANAYNGTINGATDTTDRFNNTNAAYHFDGVNDYIELSTDFDYTKRTINVWFKADTITTTINLIYDSDHANLQYGNTHIWVVETNNVKELRYMHGGSAAARHEEPINEKQWYMATIVVDSTEAKYYLDCNLLGTYGRFNGSSNDGTSNAIVGVDRNYIGYFKGSIDDLSIYNCAMPQDTICAWEALGTGSDAVIDKRNGILIYPNPSTGVFTVQGATGPIEVLDVFGRKLMEFLPRTSEFVVDLSGYARGFYFVRVGEVVRKLVLR